MSITFLNPEDVDKMLEIRKKEYEAIMDFIKNNPYPKPDEMGRIIETTIEKGFPAKPMRQLYHKDIVERMYCNLCDEDIIIECGKRMNEIKIDSPNPEHKMKWIMMATNLHILQTILEYNYDKHKTNKQYDRSKIIAMTKSIEIMWDGIGEWGKIGMSNRK